MYKHTKLYVKECPRQSILNTIDKAQNTIPKRGRIISYNTKTKSVIYSCDNCLKEK